MSHLIFFIVVGVSSHLPGESHRSLTAILLKSSAIHLPLLSRYVCKSMPSSWLEVAFTPPVCMAYTSRSGVVGTLPNLRESPQTILQENPGKLLQNLHNKSPRCAGWASEGAFRTEREVFHRVGADGVVVNSPLLQSMAVVCPCPLGE